MPGDASLRRLSLVGTIGGVISPKSIVHSGRGLFLANNMMYRHTMTIYDRDFNLVATIPDQINPSEFGIEGLGDAVKGSPVEADFTSDGRYAYVSNYQLYGRGFGNPGADACGLGNWDESWVYRVDMEALRIDQVIPVGAVPKYVAVTPDDSKVLVTNWCTFDLSIIDTASATETGRVYLGRHPRGIAVTADGALAYVAVMGSRDIAVVDLTTATVTSWLKDVGRSPRHLVLSPDGGRLYATLNGDGQVVAIDLLTGEVVQRVTTGQAPRSMALSGDGTTLYVVNYHDDTMSKVLADSLTVVQTVNTGDKPIGITTDPGTGTIWVSNYSGVIQIFSDG